MKKTPGVSRDAATNKLECRLFTNEVFISYRNEDKETAYRFCAELERRGITCWVAPRNIPAGTEWPVAIVEAIRDSRVFLVLLSKHSKKAKQISREAELADSNGCQIITVRIDDVAPPPGLTYFLGNTQWLDAFHGQFDFALEEVAHLIQGQRSEAKPRSLAPLLDGTSSHDPSLIEGNKKPWAGMAAGVMAAFLFGGGLWFGARRVEKPMPQKLAAVVAVKPQPAQPILPVAQVVVANNPPTSVEVVKLNRKPVSSKKREILAEQPVKPGRPQPPPLKAAKKSKFGWLKKLK